MRNEIARAVGMELPGTLVFDYPTVAAISGFILQKQAAPGAAAGAELGLPQPAVPRCCCQLLTSHSCTFKDLLKVLESRSLAPE